MFGILTEAAQSATSPLAKPLPHENKDPHGRSA
jgi:hypothetical protein